MMYINPKLVVKCVGALAGGFALGKLITDEVLIKKLKEENESSQKLIDKLTNDVNFKQFHIDVLTELVDDYKKTGKISAFKKLNNSTKKGA